MTSHRVRELLYRMRIEGDTPGRQAGAVALGVIIGCTPFYGLHLALSALFAKLLRLNIVLTYLAAHISLPGTLPFMIFGEIQIGRWLRGGGALPLHIAKLRGLEPWEYWQFGIDLLVGSAVVGVTLAIPLALLTYRVAVARKKEPKVHDLLEETAYRYLGNGMFDWELVRAKLRHDPVYLQVLRQGLLPSGGRLLDLGCGRGILMSLLVTARDRYNRELHPEGWAPPPADLKLHGIETRPKAARAARAALGDEARIDIADLNDSDLPSARTVLLLDVLHYLPAEAQEDLLRKITQALEPGGVLLIRDADADAGWRFTATRIQERACAMARRHWKQRFHYRSAQEWRRLLEDAGFTVDLQPMGMGTPYGNVLLTAKLDSRPQDP
jgi:uncharacterized protein (DUF2062 family)/trans-aconitate methyltransferase